jgi:succinyl-CoA synthetase beta subunit
VQLLMLEHEAKELLRAVGIDVPRGQVRMASARNAQVAAWPGDYPVAVKAQVHAGGRGKRGGVLRADSAEDAEAAVATLLTTSFDGEYPHAVLIEPWLPLKRELYLSLTVDGREDGYVVLYAPKGGVDIEQGAAPLRYPIGTPERFRGHVLRDLLGSVEADYRVAEQVIVLAQRIVATAAAQDCTTIEINPLALLDDGRLVALDAKIVRDEWAAFRNGEIQRLIDSDRARVDAHLRHCLDMKHMYVRLDGDIGLISGGAGMTMAAMDMIATQGGRAACFLDASPGPTSTRGYRPALAMLDADPRVKVIMVSVFGGGTQMQRVANAMKDLMSERTTTKPIVFRLDGTNIDQVPAILAEFGARNHDSLESAAADAVRLAKAAVETTT